MHVHYSCGIDSPTIVAEVTEVRPASPPPTPHLRSLVATSHLHLDTMISLEGYEHDTKIPNDKGNVGLGSGFQAAGQKLI
jgi:hypothetical protein